MLAYIEILGVQFHYIATAVLGFVCLLLGYYFGVKSERKFTQAQTKSLETELQVLRSQAAHREQMHDIASSMELGRRRFSRVENHGPLIRIPPTKPLVRGAYLKATQGYQPYYGEANLRSQEPPGTVLGYYCAGSDRWEHIVHQNGEVIAVCMFKDSPDCSDNATRT